MQLNKQVPKPHRLYFNAAELELILNALYDHNRVYDDAVAYTAMRYKSFTETEEMKKERKVRTDLYYRVFKIRNRAIR